MSSCRGVVTEYTEDKLCKKFVPLHAYYKMRGQHSVYFGKAPQAKQIHTCKNVRVNVYQTNAATVKQYNM
jgi:hypothetical protein